MNLNHYQILHIDEDAEYSEIKTAHRKLALQYHPDKYHLHHQQQHPENETKTNRNNNNDCNDKIMVAKEADIMFTKIQTAWECLSNEKSRMEYDDMLKRIRDKNLNDVLFKAQSVHLCDMKCEVCDVEGASDCDDGENNDSSNCTKQNLYSYTCRCGDCFEILHEELDLSTNKNVFVCESCSLSIKIVI